MFMVIDFGQAFIVSEFKSRGRQRKRALRGSAGEHVSKQGKVNTKDIQSQK